MQISEGLYPKFKNTRVKGDIWRKRGITESSNYYHFRTLLPARQRSRKAMLANSSPQ